MARNASASFSGTQTEEHAAWQSRLDVALACLRTLLSPQQAQSKAWKPVQPTQDSVPSSRYSTPSIPQAAQVGDPSSSKVRLEDNADASSLLLPPNPVQVHRRILHKNSQDQDANGKPTTLLPTASSSSTEVFRAVCQVPMRADCHSITFEDVQDSFRRLLATPECRTLWDQMVDESTIVEELDAVTRISRTIFRLGWPASQRDAVTISRTLMDGHNLIDVSCSLPRSADAPAYLRPAPPYVRSHVNLFAWCFEKSRDGPLPSMKLTVFWSWDLRGAWLGMPTGGLGARLPQMINSLVAQVRQGNATRVPFLSRFGDQVEVTDRSFDTTRDFVMVEYQVIPQRQSAHDNSSMRLDWSLPAMEGWDVHVDVKPLEQHKHASAKWHSSATRATKGTVPSSRVQLSIQHVPHSCDDDPTPLKDELRGRITIQRIAASQEVRLRLNDEPLEISLVEADDSKPSENQIQTSDDAASISGLSLQSEISYSSSGTAEDLIKRSTTPVTVEKSSSGDTNPNPAPSRAIPDRSQALASMVRRNYIYFTSLLQEPEAKWKHLSEARGVTITQLDSIDPTLVVYRAEATFVGVSVWDLFATIGNPGVKSSWDKGVEDSKLVEDLGDASKLWWTKVRGAWPVSARDSVMVETSYKSPSSIHLFAFSTDDQGMFPSLPKPDLGTIRTQVDLRGWSIESLSPTTVHVTLIEQSDPKGWTSKSSSTPSAMTAAVAGVGDYAIKNGSPPIVTRMLGAKAKVMRYEHDKTTFRVEYDVLPGQSQEENGNVECEIRCDTETWASSLDIVVDPPPINVSCLRRHKLNQGGSGLWLTIEQPVASLEDETSRITVRKGTAKERGTVVVNGARIKVDIDDLKEDEVALLRDKKRIKPQRIPLDLVASNTKRTAGAQPDTAPVSRAGTPANDNILPESESSSVFSDDQPRQPMTCALDVLFLLRRIYAERSLDPSGNPAGWTLVSQRNGLFIRRKMMQSISPTIAVQRGDKVVEGLTAEDMLSVVTNLGCRRLWDDRVDSTLSLDSYANGASTGFFTTKGSFPFRGRAFHLASMTAKSGTTSIGINTPGVSTVYFHASASYSDRTSSYSQEKLNPTALPLGRVLIDGWILETLDPYSSIMNYQIPSTRVTHLVAVDYAGSLPTTVNALWNAQLARGIAMVEDYIKDNGTLPCIQRPPSTINVVGDGRDDDHDMIWTLQDDRNKRPTTLISSKFDPISKTFSVLVLLPPKEQDEVGSKTPLSVPFPRHAALSNASTTKGQAKVASASRQLDPSVISKQAESPGDADNMTVSRATSTASIRSLARTRPSITRLDAKKPRDVVLVDVEVDLRHYQHGYSVITASEYQSSTQPPRHSEDAQTTRGSNDIDPSEVEEKVLIDDDLQSKENVNEEVFSLDAADEASQALPLEVSCFDLPPSAVLAATLDPSARPKKHLVRLTLPTSGFMDARENPFQGPDVDDAPEWFNEIRMRGCVARITLAPASSKNQTMSESLSAGDLDSQQVPVDFQGNRVDVIHVNQTSAMLQRETETDQHQAVLDRVRSPPQICSDEVNEKKAMEHRLPTQLRSPVAAMFDLQVQLPKKEQTKMSSSLSKDSVRVTPSISAEDVGDPNTPTPGRSLETPKSTTPGPSGTPTPNNQATPTSAASAQIMSILNSYPLSRLGASTAVSTAVANGGTFSRKSNDSQTSTTTGITKSNQTDFASESTKVADDENVIGMPGQLLATTEQLRKRLADIQFNLSTLILVGIIAFLLGSLFRSLLSPADYILVNHLDGHASLQAVAIKEVHHILARNPQSSNVPISWRELKRLVEIRRLFGGHWDLVVAAVQR